VRGFLLKETREGHGNLGGREAPILLLILFTVFLAVFIGTLALGKQKNEGSAYTRLKEMARQGKAPDARQAELSRPVRERILQPAIGRIAGKITSMLPRERLQKLDKRLEQSGLTLARQAGEWLVFKWVLSLMSGVLVFLFGELLSWPILKTIPATFLAVLFVALFIDWQLTNKINLRKKQIIRELPDVLDLLTISIEAGLGFDGSMGKVVEKGKGILAMEFSRVLGEMELGMARQEALKQMSSRLEVEPLKALVNSILQADQLGLGMGKVLRNQGQQVRQNRKQAAEEAAMKAPVKMLFPLVFFIFPAIFIILLGPAVLQIMEAFR